ncbi:hypothetical protein GLOIN_2v1644898 [Rhizophagus clarus]|uniref:Uncharacterized protein n=1 Tax=Rhizophagus clarus TaxID=94130 RepID=A0A8H3LLU5_9GLOM|nr:hypothetical protein GLOIN_2v1644898 [Rhizophagus clarus]
MTNINDDELIQGEEEIYADIFDGLLYKDLLQRDFFKDDRDIALSGTCDGYQIFEQRTDDCWNVASSIGKAYLDKRHLQGWAYFVKAVKLCLEPEISEEQIDDVQLLLKKFSDYYEREYYQNNGQRLAAWTNNNDLEMEVNNYEIITMLR